MSKYITDYGLITINNSSNHSINGCSKTLSVNEYTLVKINAYFISSFTCIPLHTMTKNISNPTTPLVARIMRKLE